MLRGRRQRARHEPEELERSSTASPRRGREEKAAGTGLGLVDREVAGGPPGGSIDVRSEPGGGDRVRPAAAAGPVTPSEGEEAARGELGGKRVLVVDDEPEIAALIASSYRASAPRSSRRRAARRRSSGCATGDLRRAHARRDDAGHERLRRPARPCARTTTPRRTPVVVVSVLSPEAALVGEWTVAKPIDAEELADALGAALTAGRTRVLVVGRESVRPALEPALLAARASTTSGSRARRPRRRRCRGSASRSRSWTRGCAARRPRWRHSTCAGGGSGRAVRRVLVPAIPRVAGGGRARRGARCRSRTPRSRWCRRIAS